MLEQTEEVNAGDGKERILGAKKLVVVQFWHPHCSHCQAIKPVYAELAGEYEISSSSLSLMLWTAPKMSSFPANMV